MVQIVLIRPGSTDYDNQGRIQGTLDIPLNEQGTQEVQRLIDAIRPLGITTIYCGPCQSACQTASAIAEALGVKLKKLDPLKNIDHGLWQGMLIDDVKRKQPKVYRQLQEQPEIICPPEGEMLSEAQERVQTALAKILKKHKEGTLGLVVPEPLASVVLGYLSQSEIGDLWTGASVCGKWEVVSLEPHSVAPSR
ncbi:MAG TPA: histidine phosphatase family protein [Pirellulales bacterium]|jgi:broad specificity phosphatase PhoE|nr:histidine phosphatase family protein [Pirellulales bacterium]